MRHANFAQSNSMSLTRGEQMFFSKETSEGLCQYCRKNFIGKVYHWPVPVCQGCFDLAMRPGAPSAHEIFNERWPKESREWTKRIMARPDRVEVLTDAGNLLSEVTAIGRQVDAALARKDTAEVDRLTALMNQRVKDIGTLRTDVAKLVEEIEKKAVFE